jgi:hypothetical protein
MGVMGVMGVLVKILFLNNTFVFSVKAGTYLRT